MKHRFFSSINGKRGLSAVLCGSLAISLFACSSPSAGTTDFSSAESATASADFDDFLQQFFCNEVSSNTINLHFSLSDPESFGITDYPISLGDLSEEGIAEELARTENYLETLKSFDYSSLTTEQQLTYDLLADSFSLQIENADLYLYDEPLSPSTGIQSQLPILYEEYTFYDETDITDYLQLIALTDSFFEQIIAFEQKKADAGLFMSDFACDTLISQCEDFASEGENHYLIETFNNRIDAFDGLSQQKRESYKIENEKIVLEHVLPAYEHLADALTELLGSGTNEQGLCYFPDGKEYYEYLVYYSTGCSDTIKDIQTMVANERTKVLTEASDLMAEDPELWEKCDEVSLNNVDRKSVV